MRYRVLLIRDTCLLHRQGKLRSKLGCSGSNNHGNAVGLSRDGLKIDGHKSKIGTWKRCSGISKAGMEKSRKDWRWQVVKTLGGTGDYA